MNAAVYGIDGIIVKEKRPEYSEKSSPNAILVTTESTGNGL